MCRRSARERDRVPRHERLRDPVQRWAGLRWRRPVAIPERRRAWPAGSIGMRARRRPNKTAVSAHVTLEQWPGCAQGATVEMYVIDGGGHTWPGAFPVPLLGRDDHGDQRHRDHPRRVQPMSDLVKGADGLRRCRWGASTPEYERYHDSEWGRPVVDDVRLYEKLCLEGFQSGLSWITILRKREAFRRAFKGLRPEEGRSVRREGCRATARRRGHRPSPREDRGDDREREGDARRATPSWARSRRSCGRSSRSAAPRPPRSPTWLRRRPSRPRCRRSCLRRGFKFVGPTTCYAAMQALGIVNDHMPGCYVRKACEDERRAITRPVS